MRPRMLLNKLKWAAQDSQLLVSRSRRCLVSVWGHFGHTTVSFTISKGYWGVGVSRLPYGLHVRSQSKDGWSNWSTYYRESAIRLCGVEFHVTHGWLTGKVLGGVGYPTRSARGRFYWVRESDVLVEAPIEWPDVVYENSLDAEEVSFW